MLIGCRPLSFLHHQPNPTSQQTGSLKYVGDVHCMHAFMNISCLHFILHEYNMYLKPRAAQMVPTPPAAAGASMRLRLRGRVSGRPSARKSSNEKAICCGRNLGGRGLRTNTIWAGVSSSFNGALSRCSIFFAPAASLFRDESGAISAEIL